MIKLKNILEQRGNERPINILYITDYDINHNWHVYRRLLRKKNITGTFKAYKDEDSSEMINLLHYHIADSYDFVIVQLSNLKDSINTAIQNYKRAIRICDEFDIPLIIVAPPYPKFAKHLDKDKDLIYFERIDAWLHSHETNDVMMIDLSELDDDAYFTKDGLQLNKVGNDIIFQELLQVINIHDLDIEEPEAEPEEETEEEPKPIILKQLLKGHVAIIGNVTSEQEDNIKLMIRYMNESGITDPIAQIGILAVIGKESNYIPQTENSYSNTSNDRIRSKFSKTRTLTDQELDDLKQDDEDFFNFVYGNRFENGPDEGYLYRGRGFNQLTFKSNYRTYGSKIGENLVSDPDLVNDPDNAAAIAIEFFTKGRSVPKFESISKAVTYFTNLNAGGQADRENHGSAQEFSKLFKIVP